MTRWRDRSGRGPRSIAGACLAGVLALAVLAPVAALAQQDERYGRTDIFEVAYFHENNVCAASRDIEIEDNTGSGSVYVGTFMFGAVETGGEVFGLVSVQDPDIAMELGQEAFGSVTIDGRTYDAYLAADDIDLLTAYVDFSLVRQIAYGNSAVLESPNLTYTMPLTGTLRAYGILEICFDDKFRGLGGATAPSTDQGGSGTTKAKRKPNPLQ